MKAELLPRRDGNKEEEGEEKSGEEEEEEEDWWPLHWAFHRVSYIARHFSSIHREAIFKWFAAACSKLGRRPPPLPSLHGLHSVWRQGSCERTGEGLSSSPCCTLSFE